MVAGILLNAAAGEAQPTYFEPNPSWWSWTAYATRGVALGDLELDGDLDIVCANWRDPNTTFLNSPTHLPVSGWEAGHERETMAVAVADINRDGLLDIVFGNSGAEGRNTFYLNNGAGFSEPPSWTAGESALTNCVAVADFDRDGDMDILAGLPLADFSGDSNVWLYRANAGSIGPFHNETARLAGAIKQMVVGDLNGDRLPDIVTLAVGLQCTISIIWNANGHLAAPMAVFSTSQTASCICLGDVDGDGDFDLACGYDSGRTAVFPFNGGTFESTPLWQAASSEPSQSVSLGDVDGDGDLDLVCGNYAVKGNTLYLNTGGGFTAEAVWTSAQLGHTSSAVLGDVDNDGDLDLVCGNYLQSNTVYLNRSSPLPATPDAWSSAVAPSLCLAAGDVNGDGHLDLVVGNRAQVNQLYLGGENGPASEPAWQAEAESETYAVALGDVDGDGDLDLVCGNTNQPTTLYHFRAGTFSPTADWSLPGGPRNTRGVALGDLDGDGRLDLVCANNAQPSEVYLNGGGSFAAPAHWVSAEADPSTSVALGDVDGDGDLDMVFGNAGTGNTLYLNDNGSFRALPDWRASDESATYAVALGDIDGDGDLDLACGNRGARESNTVYLNTGGLFSAEPQWRSGPTKETYGIALGDVDGDLDLDLWCGSLGGDDLYLNDGSGLPTSPYLTTAASATMGCVLGDVDNDGDLDCLTACFNETNKVYRGLRLPVFKGDPQNPTHHLPENGPYLKDISVEPAGLNLYRIRFKVYDIESDPVWIIPEYHFEGAHAGDVITVPGLTGRLGPCASSPVGVADSLDWDISRLPFDSRQVVVRLVTTSIPQRSGVIRHATAHDHRVAGVRPLRPELSVEPASVDFPMMTVGDRDSTQIILSNTGSLEVTVTGIEPPSPEMRVDPSLPLVLPPGGTGGVDVFLEPVSGLGIAGAIAIASDDPIHPVTSIPVHSDVRDLVVRSRLLSPADSIPLGEAVTVIITPDPGVRVETGELHYRPASSTGDFSHSIPISPSGNDFIATIPGGDVTEAGLEYYIRVQNGGVSRTDPSGAPEACYAKPVRLPTGIAAGPFDPGPFLEGRSIDVLVQMPEGAVFLRGMLHFRRGGERTFRADTLKVYGTIPTGVIPDSLVTSRGVEYWVEVTTLNARLTDPPVAPATSPRVLPVEVFDLEEPSVHAANAYRLVTVPLQFDAEVTLENMLLDQAAFGRYDPTQWRAWRWLPEAGRYMELSEGPTRQEWRMLPGLGFWLISRSPNRIDTAPMRGSSPSTECPYYGIDLQPGWNLFGDPYGFPVAWDSLAVGDVPILDVISVGGVIEAPWRWDGSRYRQDVNTLRPFEAYWVNNITEPPEVIHLAVPPVESEDAGAAALRADLLGNGEWHLDVSASCRGASDAGNAIGAAMGASEEWDANDRMKPPMCPGKAISLYFPHERWRQRAGRYSRDIRPLVAGVSADARAGAVAGSLPGTATGVSGWSWMLDVAKSFAEDGADEVTLRLDGVGAVPPACQVLLVDRLLLKTIDLREEPSYVFLLGNHEPVARDDEARFCVVIGDAGFIDERLAGLVTPPARTSLWQNRPNPFNPSTVIRFDVARPGAAALRIYDLTGALVRTLYAGAVEPGGYELAWKGEDKNGRRVASGVYVYRLETSWGYVETRKLVMVQ